MSYLGLYYYIRPQILFVIQSLPIDSEPIREASNSLYLIRDSLSESFVSTPKDIPYNYKQQLKEEGRRYFTIIHELAIDITKKNRCLMDRRSVVHIVYA